MNAPPVIVGHFFDHNAQFNRVIIMHTPPADTTSWSIHIDSVDPTLATLTYEWPSAISDILEAYKDDLVSSTTEKGQVWAEINCLKDALRKATPIGGSRVTEIKIQLPCACLQDNKSLEGGQMEGSKTIVAKLRGPIDSKDTSGKTFGIK